MKQRDHPLPVLPAIEDGVVRIRLAEQKLHAGNAQHDILQGRGVQAKLGMLHLRVHNDHIVRLYREQLPGKVELSLAAEAVEQLCAGVGVGGTVPIAAKFAFADVQQPEGFPWSGSMTDIKSLGTHKWLLLRRRTKNIKIKTRY